MLPISPMSCNIGSQETPKLWSLDPKICWIDFMFATSVHFWLKDTTEFDRLMTLAKEVVYEGHEQYDVERDRLKKWGFTEIKSIGITGRLRSVFHAKKGR